MDKESISTRGTTTRQGKGMDMSQSQNNHMEWKKLTHIKYMIYDDIRNKF